MTDSKINSKETADGKWERKIINVLKQVMWAIGSIILALLIAALIMIAIGFNYVTAYVALIRGGILAPDRVLWYATPLIFTGLSVALAFQCGLFNIGAEGQLYIGSMAATIVGFSIALPIIVHPLVCILIGVLTGLIYGILPGILKAYRGAHEVVTTMMLTYTATLFTEWLTTGPLQQPGQMTSQTPPLYVTAWLPKIGRYLHWGFFIAILCAIGVAIFLNRTVIGYEMRAVGKNQTTAEAAGINSKRMMVLALGISGGLAGLAGTIEIMGHHHRFINLWSGGLGFDGITVAVLGANNPYGVIFAAIFFGFLRSGAVTMQTIANVPIELVGLIQGLVVLFVAAPRIIEWLARQNISYAKWMVQTPSQAVPLFITSLLALINAIIWLGSGFANLHTDPYLSIPSIILSFVALMGFVGILKTEKWGGQALLIVSLTWLILAAYTFVFLNWTLLIPWLILGSIKVPLSFYSYHLIVRKGTTMEDLT